MKLGIVGLPNVGKSTLFNALTNAGAGAANYPFCTIEPNVGIVSVPDERLDYLAGIYSPEKYTPATIEFVDIAGLVRGASKGEGLGNKFLSHIREVDSVIHVVRCFEDGNIIHVDGSVDPIRDVETINLELIYSDIEIVERRKERAEKLLKGDKSKESEIALLGRLLDFLNEGKSARGFSMTDDEREIIADMPLLSAKPVIYAANVSEDDIASGIENCKPYAALEKFAKAENSGIIPICASIEAELAELDADDAAAFLEELGIKERGLNRLIKESYSLLGLISFLTAGPKEVRAWTIVKGTKAPQAAGKIHSDFERGFIRAEIIAYDDFVACGGNTVTVREKGLLRSEGKEYVMKDGDITLFRFNV